MKKRGLSTIVVTLIIILLSLVAIGVVWVVVRSLIEGSSEKIEFSQFAIDLDIKNAYEDSGNINVNVKRNVGDGELIKIKFILFDGENSEGITQGTKLEELEYKNFILDPVELVSTEIESVSVAPIFKSADGEEVLGEITDTYYLTGEEEENGEECTPDCTDLECGPDPICQEECGPCTGTDICSNGVCVPESCIPETLEETCGEWVCGERVNNCGMPVECPPGCEEGQMCDDGTCIDITAINIGTVEETWPGTSGMYFGSSDLPIDISYEGYYIEFPESAEEDCLLIAIYKFPVPGYDKSHIGFNFETSIQTNDNYQIWAELDECQA